MSKKLIKCSNCEETIEHEKTNDPIEITNETGFVPTENGWLCPDCVDDLFYSEGC